MTDADPRDQSAISGRHICLLTRRELRQDARIARTASALAEAGARVSVVAASVDLEALRIEQHEDGYCIYRVIRQKPKPVDRGGPGLLGAVWRFARSLRSLVSMARVAIKLNADIYHASDLQPLPVAWLVAAFKGKPYVYEAREISTDREAFKRFARAIAVVEGYLSRRGDGFITTTDMRAEYFQARYGLERAVVVQNRPVFAESPPTRRLREALGLSEEVIICLYQGGLQQGRGLMELIDAAVRVPEAHFVMLGGGNLLSSLVEHVRALGLEDRVHLLPPVAWNELVSWTASADVGIQLLQNTCLNHYTTDSNKLFECAMAGLPVVASDFPEIRKVVEAWQFGLLVDPADQEAVITSLRQLATDATLRRRLAENARRAAPHLDWQSQVPGLIRLYREILEPESVSAAELR